jgi:hypothetical protein
VPPDQIFGGKAFYSQLSANFLLNAASIRATLRRQIATHLARSLPRCPCCLRSFLRSPRIAHRVQPHLAYSNQIAEGGGVITGGLDNVAVCSPDPVTGITPYLCPLDHNQRNTLNVGGIVTLPWSSYASTNVYYGSGFSNGQQGVPGWPYTGAYLPGHTTFDLSLGKDFGKQLTATFTALNVTNRRVIYDDSLTYGGFHWNLPRQLYVELR